jgi:hypothetical protein
LSCRKAANKLQASEISSAEISIAAAEGAARPSEPSSPDEVTKQQVVEDADDLQLVIKSVSL